MNFLPETWILGSKFLTYLKQLSDLFRVESSNAFVKVQFKQVRLQTMWLSRRMGLPRISRNIKGLFVCLYLIFLWKNAGLKKKKVHYLREWLHAVSEKYEESEYQLWQGCPAGPISLFQPIVQVPVSWLQREDESLSRLVGPNHQQTDSATRATAGNRFHRRQITRGKNRAQQVWE